MEYYQVLLSSIASVFTIEVMFWLFCGVLVGMFFGLMPGLAGPQALAMLLPLTFTLDFTHALALLIGIAGSATCAGSLTSILIGVPGTPINAATVIDGYPMTKQGKAGMAIGAACTSSALGGIFGTIVLLILLPYGFNLILKFSFPEFFAITMLGICMIAFVTEGSFLKGLIAGVAGLAMSCIGFDPFINYPRCSFGISFLWDRLDIVSVVIGLFAIAEAIELFRVDKDQTSVKANYSLAGVFDGVKATFKNLKSVLIGSLIGTGVGIMPGVGGGVAQFLAYSATVSTSKDKSKFGKGDVRGVIGAEASNNAKDGGSLVPALLFGIPGSVDTAILLGAFMMHGISPGITLFDKNPEALVTIIWSLLMATVASVILSIFCAPYLTNLLNVPKPIIGTAVLILAVMGIYVATNSYGDIILAFVIGLVGYLMKKNNFSRVCLIIGFMLGNIAEMNLRRGLLMFGLQGFLLRPLVIIIFLVTAGLIVLNIRARKVGGLS